MLLSSLAATTSVWFVYIVRLFFALIASLVSSLLLIGAWGTLGFSVFAHWLGFLVVGFLCALTWMWIGLWVSVRDTFSSIIIFLAGAAIPSSLFISEAQASPPLFFLIFCLLGGSLTWCWIWLRGSQKLAVTVAVPLMVLIGCVSFAYKNVYPGIGTYVEMSGRTIKVASDGNELWAIENLWIARSSGAASSRPLVQEILLPTERGDIVTSLWIEEVSDESPALCQRFIDIRDNNAESRKSDPMSSSLRTFFYTPCSKGIFYRRCTDEDACEQRLK